MTVDPTIEELEQLVKGKTEAQAHALIDNYFSKITWSLEKDEWENKMTPEQKDTLVKELLK